MKKQNKIKTIADLKIDLTIEKQSFKSFYKNLMECIAQDGEIWLDNNKNLIENFERKVIDGTYKIIVPIMSARVVSGPLECFTETLEIKSKNMILGKFIYKICSEIQKLLEKYDDWHIFLEGFRKVDHQNLDKNIWQCSSTYQVSLGS
jgi:hypothetical protein